MPSIDSTKIIHWQQMTSGGGAIQPWFREGGWLALEDRLAEASALTDRVVLWMIHGWKPQPSGKIPANIVDDGRTEYDKTLENLIKQTPDALARLADLGLKVMPYTGSPQMTDAWSGLPTRRIATSAIDNLDMYNGLEVIFDKMTDCSEQWNRRLRLVSSEVTDRPVYVEGRIEPPVDFGWFRMLRDMTDDDINMMAIAAANRKHPSIVLIRGDADLGLRSRMRAVETLVDAGLHVCTDATTVL